MSKFYYISIMNVISVLVWSIFYLLPFPFSVLSFTVNNFPTVLTNHYTDITTRIKGKDKFLPCHIQRKSILYQSNINEELTKDEQDRQQDDDNNGIDEGLSDLDARVLQSLLDDKNLDLKSEANLKKMLENNKKPKGGSSDRNAKRNESDNSEFSSTVFKTITDNAVWNSVRAKADSILESTKIFLQNRIERDAQLLASLSLFAWDRVVKDVARALPSAGSSGARAAESMKKTILALSNNSSFIENTINTRGPLLLSSFSQYNQTMVQERTIYDELTTPRDEIMKVSESIRDILSGKSSSSDRGLRSIAPGGASRNVERQKMAFERRKETVLKREKEGIDKKAMRAASSLTDVAWEIKREMETEGNDAGYRSEATMKRIEASIKSSALLEGGKNWMNRRLSGNERDILQLESSTQNESTKKAVTETKDFSPNLSVQEAAIIEPEVTEPLNSSFAFEEVNQESFVKNEIENPFEEELKVELEVKSEIDDTSLEAIPEEDLKSEMERIVSVLRSCLEEPETTWLKPELLVNETKRPFFLSPNNENDEVLENEEAWEKVIIEMVSAKSELEAALEVKDMTTDQKLKQLAKLKDMVDRITYYVSECAGDASASYLRKAMNEQIQEASNFNSKNSNQVDVQTKDMPEAQVEDDLSLKGRTEWKNDMESNFEEAIDDQYETVVIADIVLNEAEEAPTEILPTEAKTAELFYDIEFEFDESKRSFNNDYSSDDLLATEVEVIAIDDDFITEDTGGMNSAAADDESSSEPPQDRNMVAELTLRTLDVLFFIAEKTFTVGLPGMYDLIKSIGEKTDRINRNGLGKQGWDRLINVNDGRSRY